jgi:hypothetical protein
MKKYVDSLMEHIDGVGKSSQLCKKVAAKQQDLNSAWIDKGEQQYGCIKGRHPR